MIKILSDIEISKNATMLNISEVAKKCGIEDEDLEDPDTFKVVYAGSIRKVNNVMMLVDAAMEIDSSVQFLIWGDGDQLEEIRVKVKEKRRRKKWTV